MCYNCGCHMLQDDHGQPDNITEESIRKAGQGGGTESGGSKARTPENSADGVGSESAERVLSR